MEDKQIVVLDEGVTVRQVAAAITCCQPGAPNVLRTEPDPSA